MSADILGYNKEVRRIMSSDYAIFSVEGGDVGLVQSVQIAYQHAVKAVHEAGSSNLHWQTGQSMGQGSVARSIGTKFLGIKGIGQSANAELIKCVLQTRDTGAFSESVLGEGTIESIRCGGIVVEGVNFNVATGGMDVSEQISLKIGSVTQ